MNKHRNEVNDTRARELVISQTLLKRVVSAHSGLDVVAYGALACNSPSINKCMKLNVDVVVRIKKSQIGSIKKVKNVTSNKKYTKKWYDGNKRIKVKTNNLFLKEIKRVTNKTDSVLIFIENGYAIEVYESAFYMNDMHQPIRYIKYAKEKEVGDETERIQMLIITTCINMKLEKLYRIIRAR